MKQGKISENVLKRSVLKYIDRESTEIARGAGIGNDCALFAFHGSTRFDSPIQSDSPSAPFLGSAATGTCSFAVKGREKIRHAIYAAINNLAAGSQQPEYLLLTITLPEQAREIRLQEMMEEAASICKAHGLHIVGGHTEVSANVTEAVVSVTAMGSPAVTAINNEKNISDVKQIPDVTDYDIVVSKYIGSEAVGMIAHAKEEELLSRFPKWLVEDAKDDTGSLSVLKDAEVALANGAVLMHDIGEGGIFAALWEMAQRAGKGLSIAIKKIPMKQTIVEICNYYDLNPYELLSQGCLLIAAPDGEALVAALEAENIPAAVIGKLTAGNDRIIENGEEIRYMDLPKPDQIRKLL